MKTIEFDFIRKGGNHVTYTVFARSEQDAMELLSNPDYDEGNEDEIKENFEIQSKGFAFKFGGKPFERQVRING